MRVAVITASIGRKELERAIRSVEAQTYPATHYVFIDGAEFHPQAMDILSRHPNVKALYLPHNTGANGKTNGCIHAAASFLVEEDIICYLDDDNWYEPQHIEKGVNALQHSNADYAYALRNFIDDQGNFVCIDSFESVGDLNHQLPKTYILELNVEGNIHKIGINFNLNHFIDTNCYFIRKETAQLLGNAWTSGLYNDRNVYHTLKELNKQGICTRTISVNYTVDIVKYLHPTFQDSLFDHLSEQEKTDIKYLILQALSRYSVAFFEDKNLWEKA